jgi:hypothetical protein
MDRRYNSICLVIIVFLSIFFLCTSAFSQYHQSPGPGEKPSVGRNVAQISDISPNSITVSLPNNKTHTIHLTPRIQVLRHDAVTLDELAVGDYVMLRGKFEGAASFIPFVIVAVKGPSDPNIQHMLRSQKNRNVLMGEIIQTSPLVVKTMQQRKFEVTPSPNTQIVKESRMALADLKVGDTVHLFPKKIIVIGSRQALSQTASSRSKDFKRPSLPTPPEITVSFFDPNIIIKSKNSPFGFFDPNMLRFDHVSWFGDYVKVMNDLRAQWASYGASFSYNWNLIEGQTFGGDKWERFDRLVKHARASNIDIIGYIKASEPNPGQPAGSRIKPSLPKNIEAYKQFVQMVVERYDMDGKNDMPGLEWPIKYWSIEDEPLAPIYFDGTGADYAKVLNAAYDAVKSADPEAKVICSMLRGTGWHIKDKNREFMKDFFQQLQKLGKKRPYDYMDQHWIGYDQKGESHKRTFYKELMADIDQTGLNYGFEPAPYVALEVAGVDKPEFDQAVDLIKRHVILLSLGVERILWSGIQAAPKERLSPKQANNYFRQVTLLDGEGQKKLAYFTYKLMVNVLDGSDWKKTEYSLTDEGISIFKFFNNSNPIWVIWRENEDQSMFKLGVPQNTRKLDIIETVPNAKSGKDIIGYNNAFKKETRDLSTQAVEIQIGDIPLIISGY